jgi:asparagine synthase (glutamine-hydrolysing)
MCGIAGFLPRSSMSPSAVEARVHAMVRSQIHRGPDDEGFFVTPHIRLGMRRLAIKACSDSRCGMPARAR